MSRHDDTVRLRHMLEYSREAMTMASGRTKEELASNRMLNLALIRLIEVIGEAAARVSPETRDKYPDIPWVQMIGTRNRLIHGYDILDWDILWDTIHEDIPHLVEKLEKIV